MIKFILKRALTVLAIACLAIILFACNKNEKKADNDYKDFLNPIINDVQLNDKGTSKQIPVGNYNQVAVDALGRTLPTYDEVGGPREGKYVGLFYLLWTESISQVQDNSKIYAQNPVKPQLGTKYAFHFWGEPETGYHKANDPWQIRRDMNYFADAGIDFIYLDFTNGFMYPDSLDVLLDTMLEMRAQGIMVPYVVPWNFCTASGNSKPGSQNVKMLYDNYYMNEKYKSLWFYWEGKPLLLAKPTAAVEKLKDGTKTFFPAFYQEPYKSYFNMKFSWVPGDNDEGHLPGMAKGQNSWVDMGYLLDKHYSYKTDPSQCEAVGIGTAGFAQPGMGKSGSQAKLDRFLESPKTQGEGLLFQQTFDWALDKDPEVILITRWNEWIAQYFPDIQPYHFVDQFNTEYSRDIEPMKGGYTDNYYYQMCANIRRFKGMPKPNDIQNAKKTIQFDENFADWADVGPNFIDYIGDTVHRNSKTGKISYVNNTGRNDITETKVACDASNVYFFAKTANNLTPFNENNWMLLFVDADNNKKTGWEGYDYLINKNIINDKTATICKYQNGIFQEIGLVNYNFKENQLEIRVPRATLGLKGKYVDINFHWNDNISKLYDMYYMFTTGDSAPERRADYHFKMTCKYSSKGQNILTPRQNPSIYMDSVQVINETPGLLCSKYNIVKNYGKQPNLDLLEAPPQAEVVSTISAELAEDISKNAPDKPGHAVLKFEGFIKIPDDGYYTFYLNSHDGSLLYVDDRLIVDNGGVHELKEAEGTIGLCKGMHNIRVEYFDNGDNGMLQLEAFWKSNKFDKQAIGEDALFK